MKTRCPHCDIRLTFDREVAYCPQCHSTFTAMPSLRELAGIVNKLTERERALIGHFANNPLAVVVMGLSFLADADLPAELADAVADAREGANALHLVIATLTGVDTNVQSR